jgi:DNA-binding NarL/FixJ family response regulator
MPLSFSEASVERRVRTSDLVLVEPLDDVPGPRRAAGVRPIRVLIADDQAVVRTGLRAMLETEADILVVAQASRGDEAVAMTRDVGPDVVLLDAGISGPNAVEAMRGILDQSERTGARVLVLAADDTDDFLFSALRAGASGFLLKNSDAADLVEAVRVVAAGAALLSPGATERLIAEFASQPQPHLPSDEQLEELTPREREVMALVATGLSNDEIAARFVISRATVKTHVSRALGKLDVRDRAQLVAVAYQAGLVRPGHSRRLRSVPSGFPAAAAVA